MKVIHLLGHRAKWNLDACFENKVGSGFTFCAYSFDNEFVDKAKIGGYEMSDVLQMSMLDLQFFGKKESGQLTKGELKTYDFHPANSDEDKETNEYMLNSIKRGIKFQIDSGFTDIIIPNYYENEDTTQLIGLIRSVNSWLDKNKKSGRRYFMTLPLTNHTIIDDTKIESILNSITDDKIIFDGYYVVCEPKPDNNQKVSTDTKYLRNLARVLTVLKKQKFVTILSYANWDSTLFLALTDIDYITIGTYENLRNFSIRRFTNTDGGGPSKGWYFSEKLLNFVKAQFIDLIREKNCIPLIRNEKNIFSDAILDKGYLWNNHKQEVHKNYLVSINGILLDLASIPDITKRKTAMISKIDRAMEAYDQLEKKKVYLLEESRNYHLAVWKSFLLSR